MSERLDIHNHITGQILAMMESGQGRFELPWHRSAASVRPANAATGNPYNGINILALWAAAENAGYCSGHWATYRQWAALGAQVRKGEKATHVIFYKQNGHSGPAEDAGADEPDARRNGAWLVRASAVFAAEQVSGYRLPLSAPVDPVAACHQAEDLVRATGAVIRHGGERACYIPATDEILLPPPDAFIGTSTSSPTQAYYSTLFHELTHWTGHAKRCDRELGKRFGEAAYAMEELIAELGAAFLCADLGIVSTPRPDHAHYLAHWLNVLRQDRKALFSAASRASQATAFLQGLSQSGRQDGPAGAPAMPADQIYRPCRIDSPHFPVASTSTRRIYGRDGAASAGARQAGAS